MKIQIAEVGEVELRKISKRDWEIIRNNCIRYDAVNKRDVQDLGSFIKWLCVLGIKKAPFFKTEYLENSRLNLTQIEERENEYYDTPIEQKVFDELSNKIKEFNTINVEEVKEIKKEQSSI